jgi:hypothetical protein
MRVVLSPTESDELYKSLKTWRLFLVVKHKLPDHLRLALEARHGIFQSGGEP